MSDPWNRALRFAALPGARKVTFEKHHIIAPDGQPVTQYRLQSFAAAGQRLGDDRDYDMLKAVMAPLERLASQADHEEFMIELDVERDLIFIREE